MKRVVAIGAMSFFLVGNAAYANDVEAAGEKCFDIGSVGKLYKKLDSIKAKRRDSVDTVVQAYFAEVETRTTPMTLYVKNGDVRDEFVVTGKGEVIAFHAKTRGLPDSAEICGTVREDGKIGMGMGTDVQFKNNSGTHTLAEITDGVGDGKSHYKKMLPGPMAMFVPKMTHVLLTYDDLETAANVKAVVAGVPHFIETEAFGQAHVINVDDLVQMKADSLIIAGGAYILSPVPSIKKMKSLGFGPSDGSDEDTNSDEASTANTD